MVLWQPWYSRHVLFTRERAASSTLEPCALSRLRALFHVGVERGVRIPALMSFLISCMLVSCSAHGWWFVCWPCACVFVLCEHMAFVLVFCVPCALMSIVLTPPILFPDYWFICSLYNLLVFAVLCQFVIICFLFLPYLVVPCPAKPCQLTCFSPTG